MENRRRNGDRRQNNASDDLPPYMTKDGLVFADRRKTPDRRRIDLYSLIDMGEVEEIEITAV